MSLRLRGLNAYELHKTLINEYFLTHQGDSGKLHRDTSQDKRDIDVLKENHQFLWDEQTDKVDSWDKQLAKKYYDKLFKEYCISDLSRYKENKVGLRWQTEQELVDGKGQFICGNKTCSEKENLKTWEVNFGYVEQEMKKSALVKLRLCPPCSTKLNYHHKRKEIKRLKRQKSRKYHREKPMANTGEPSVASCMEGSQSVSDVCESSTAQTATDTAAEVWNQETAVTEEKSRDEEFEDYLEELFL